MASIGVTLHMADTVNRKERIRYLEESKSRTEHLLGPVLLDAASSSAGAQRPGSSSSAGAQAHNLLRRRPLRIFLRRAAALPDRPNIGW